MHEIVIYLLFTEIQKQFLNPMPSLVWGNCKNKKLVPRPEIRIQSSVK